MPAVNDPALRAWDETARPHLRLLADSTIVLANAIGDTFAAGFLDDAGRQKIRAAARGITAACDRCSELPPAPDLAVDSSFQEAFARHRDAATAVMSPRFAATVNDRADVRAAAAHLAEAADALKRAYRLMEAL